MAGEKIHWTLFLGLLLASLSPTSASECPAYKCKPSSMNWNSTTCAYYDRVADTYYSRSMCKKTEECVRPGGTEYFECQTIAPTNTTLTIYPGEKCGPNLLCHQSSNCTTGDICPGIQQGQPCDNDDNKFCDVGLYCDGTCKPVLKAGDSCTLGNQCQVGMGCYLQKPTEGICMSFFSIKPGDEVLEYNIFNTDFSEYCLYMYAFSDPSDPEVYLCAEPLESSLSSSKSCSVANKCYSKPNSVSKTVKEVDCVCGRNPDGNAYCQEFIGDKYSEKYHELVVKWVTGKMGQYCSEGSNNDKNQCAKDWYADYDRVLYYRYRSQFAPEINDADDCVLANFLYEYYWVQKTYTDSALLLSAVLYLLIN